MLMCQSTINRKQTGLLNQSEPTQPVPVVPVLLESSTLEQGLFQGLTLMSV